MSDASAQPNEPNLPRKKRRIVLKLFFLLVLLVVAALGPSVYLLRTDPASITRQRAAMDAKTPEEIHALSQSLQNKVASLTALQLDDNTRRLIETGQADPAMIRTAMMSTLGQVRTINLTLPELNAWLRAELPQYLNNLKQRIPDGVSDPGLTLEGENLVAYFRLEFSGVSQTVSFIFTLDFHEQGPATVKLLQVRGGRLPVPQTVISAQGREDPNSRINAIARSFAGSDFDPVIHHLQDDVRQPRIISMKVNADSLDLTVRIDPLHSVASATAPKQAQAHAP